MDWMKVLTHGLKAFLFVVLGAIVTIVLGALTAATTYVPEGGIVGVLWTYAGLPLIVGLIAAIENWWKHRDKK